MELLFANVWLSPTDLYATARARTHVRTQSMRPPARLRTTIPKVVGLLVCVCVAWIRFDYACAHALLWVGRRDKAVLHWTAAAAVVLVVVVAVVISIVHITLLRDNLTLPPFENSLVLTTTTTTATHCGNDACTRHCFAVCAIVWKIHNNAQPLPSQCLRLKLLLSIYRAQIKIKSSLWYGLIHSSAFRLQGHSVGTCNMYPELEKLFTDVSSPFEAASSMQHEHWGLHILIVE